MPKKTREKKAALTLQQFASLSARGGVIYFERARICVMRLRDASTGVSDRWFVMEGPSGRHTLLVDATDLARLNAHWTVFATHPLNAMTKAA